MRGKWGRVVMECVDDFGRGEKVMLPRKQLGREEGASSGLMVRERPLSQEIKSGGGCFNSRLARFF